METPVWIEALGCGDPNGCTAETAVVAQRAVVRFTRGRTEEVPLLLASACVGVTCASDERCGVGGRCEPASRAQETVRPFVSIALTGGEDSAVPDASMDTGSVADATLDAHGDEAVLADGSVDTGVVTDDVQSIDSPDVGVTEDVPPQEDALDATADVGTDAPSLDAAIDGPDAATAPDGSADVGVIGDHADVAGADDGPSLLDAGLDGSTRDVGSDLGTDAGTDVGCGAALTLCGGVCRNLQTDAANCGTCGSACTVGRTCVGGACVTAAPSNDTCAGAQEISFASASVTLVGTTVGATPSITPSCGTSVTTDVYYRFTVPGPSRELVYADSVGSSFDTVLYFARDCGTALTGSTTPGDIVCNDDMGVVGCNGGVQSQVVAMLNPGTWYLMVGGYGGSTGTISLRVQHLPVGSGGVTLLPAGSTTQGGATSGSGSMGGPCGGGGAGESTWWWRTCPDFVGGGFSATTCSRANWDTLIYVRNAAGGGDVCNDDACSTLQSSINGTIPPGPGIHTFTVDGSGANTGSFSVLITRP